MGGLLLISLQKSGAAPRDALEFSNALCELKATHTIVIAKGNELLASYTNNDYRVVKVIPTFSSSPASFLFSTLTLIRPLRLLSFVTRYTTRVTRSVVFTTHFHPWLVLIPVARFFRSFNWYHAVHENPFDTKEVRSSIAQKLEQFCFYRANRIVCYSEYMRSQLSSASIRVDSYSRPPRRASIRDYSAYKLSSSLPQSNQVTKQLSNSSLPLLLPVGAYTTALNGVVASTKYKKPGRILVGCLGRIEPYKDIDTLLSAFKILEEKNLPVDLLIAGRGSLPDVTAFSSPATHYSLLTTHYFFENRWLSSDEITALALECEIIVVPYKKASQSGIIALALAAGKPVIATNVGGLPEQIEDGSTGIVVPPGDPQALATAIESLVNNPTKITEMGLSARSLGSGRLSWKRAGEKFMEEVSSL